LRDGEFSETRIKCALDVARNSLYPLVDGRAADCALRDFGRQLGHLHVTGLVHSVGEQHLDSYRKINTRAAKRHFDVPERTERSGYGRRQPFIIARFRPKPHGRPHTEFARRKPRNFYELIEWWAALARAGSARVPRDLWDTQADMFLALVDAALAWVALSRIHDRQIEKVNMPA
jgi:hypothetical protein